MKARCEKQQRDPMKVEREVGRLLGQNTRAARLFEVTVSKTDAGFAHLEWKQVKATRDWATLSAGCYLLRTNVTNWTDEELWKACIQLTEAEAAFRIHKSDLTIRPIWHQKGGACAGSHLRVLPGVCAVEDAGPTVRSGRAGQRTATRAVVPERTGPDGCRAPDPSGPGNPPPLPLNAERSPTDPPGSPQAPAPQNKPIANVVTTFGLKHTKTLYMRRLLGNLG